MQIALLGGASCRSLPGGCAAPRTTVADMPSPRMVAAAVVAVLIVRLAGPAIADDVIPGPIIDRQTNGVVIGGALIAALRLSLIPVRTDRPLWRRELFGNTDAAVHARFSPRAAQISDAAVAATVVAPIVYLT